MDDDDPLDLDLRPKVIVRAGEFADVRATTITLFDGINGQRVADGDQRALYSVGGRPAYVELGDDSHRVIRLTSSGADTVGTVEGALRFVRPTKDGGESPIDAPPRLVSWLWAEPADRWGCPPLEIVSAVPLLRPDGTVVATAGYDKRARAFVDTDPAVAKLVPASPTAIDASVAADRVMGLFSEFPWQSDADLANYTGAQLTAVGRTAFAGPSPFLLIDANLLGSGKTLLSDLLGVTSMGMAPPATSLPDNEEEQRKAITSVLITGAAIIKIDNLAGVVASATLARLATSRTWADRMLGQTRTVVVPNKALTVINGNNLTVGGDLVRRCVLVRLATDSPEPWLRSDFTIPDLMGHVTEYRAEIVAALLTMWAAWLRLPLHERPMGPNMGGGFSDWSTKVGGVLELAGVTGFLTNSRKVAESDIDAEHREDLVRALFEHFGDESFYVAQVVAVIDGRAKADLLTREDLADACRALVRGFDTASWGGVQLGHLLRQLCDRPVRVDSGIATLRRAGDDLHVKRKAWRVEATVPWKT